MTLLQWNPWFQVEKLYGRGRLRSGPLTISKKKYLHYQGKYTFIQYIAIALISKNPVLLVLKGTAPHNGQVEDNIRLRIHMPLPAGALVVIPPCMIFLVFF